MDSTVTQRLSLRRSHLRARILIILMRRGTLTMGHLADLAGVEERRVRWALYGSEGTYREDLALVRCGLVVERTSAAGAVLRLSSAGAALARATMHERRERAWA